ncbi:hypothetical protein GCM10025792_02970 [Pseudonocardia tropica]
MDRGGRHPGPVGALTVAAPTVAATMLARLRALHGWWRGVIGADLYDRYLDHHRRSGHDHPPMTEREYWRARTAYQEDNPQGRCC